MKKLFLLTAMFAFALTTVQAQLNQRIQKTDKNPSSATSPKAPAPAPAAKTSNTTAPSVYTLTSARVNIRTGADNKEFPSQVRVILWPRSTPTPNGVGIARLVNELRANSNTDFGIELNTPTSLETFQQSGLMLKIFYDPNFFMDAWKIESITMDLQFKDQYGNLHPAYGNKTIAFSMANGFLNTDYRIMECLTDAAFSPTTSAIKRQY